MKVGEGTRLPRKSGEMGHPPFVVSTERGAQWRNLLLLSGDHGCPPRGVAAASVAAASVRALCGLSGVFATWVGAMVLD
jgi:hypothetical protein